MKEYVITIEETVSQEFIVAAESEEEAMNIAEQNYNEGIFVLEPGNLVSKCMMCENPDGNVTEWVEF